jgi:hypothetical protein
MFVMIQSLQLQKINWPSCWICHFRKIHYVSPSMVVVKVVSYEVKYWEGAWWACVCFGPAPPSAATYKEHTASPFQPLTTKFGFLRCQPLSNLSGQKVPPSRGFLSLWPEGLHSPPNSLWEGKPELSTNVIPIDEGRWEDVICKVWELCIPSSFMGSGQV